MRKISKILDCDFSATDNTIDFIIIDNYSELWFITYQKYDKKWGEWKRLNFPKFPKHPDVSNVTSQCKPELMKCIDGHEYGK